jgi:carbon-monoxide dehydrogenase medium subunit
MGQITSYVRARSVEEAVQILRERCGKAVPLAGGTSLSLHLPAGVDTLVDLSQAGLSGVRETPDHVVIGALTPLADLAASPVVQTAFDGVLAKAAGKVAATPLRNRITLGGNAVQVYWWSDLPAVLLALDAQFVLQATGERRLPAAEFFANQPRRMLAPHELVTQVLLPKGEWPVQAAHVKVARTGFDFAALSVCCVCHMDGPRVAQAAVTLGAVRPLPVRVQAAEDEIVGKVPDRHAVVNAAARAAGAVDPAQDVRYSKEYRTQLIKVWVKRALSRALRLE